jgi:hypothetical protein
MTKARDIASAAPAPSTVSATEIGYLDGVTSAVQTQIDSKSGTSHNHDSTYIAKSLVTTTGDIIYASGASTPARLGIGSSGQYLTVSGGVPAWATLSAGGMTLLSTTTLSGSSVTISDINQSYNDLLITVDNYYASVNQTDYIYFRINNDSTASRHGELTTLGQSTSSLVNKTQVTFAYGLSNAAAGAFGYIYIPNYTNTNIWKRGFVSSGGNNAYDPGLFSNTTQYWVYNQTTAVSSINLRTSANNFSAGTVKIYGVK